MTQVNHNELEKMIRRSDKTKESLTVRGDTGIGKSVVVKETARDVAEEEEREFVEWSELTIDERESLINNEEVEIEGESLELDSVFLFIDKRFAESDPSDTKGIPDLNEDYVKWKIPLWVKAITKADVRGYLFLDEFNQAPNIVQASFFNLILDREIVERKVSDRVAIIGAGNRIEDSSAVNQMPDPLKDRFINVTLKPPKADMSGEGYDWAEWAIANDIDTRIISFLSSDMGEDQIHREYQDTEVGEDTIFPTPRSWERVSDLIKDMDTNYELMRKYVTSCVGETAGNRFLKYVEELENQNIEKYIEDPSKASEINNKTSIDQQYKIITAIGHTINQTERFTYDQEELCERIMDVGFELETVELHAMLIRIAKLSYNSKNEEKFRRLVVESYGEKIANIEDRVGKYLN